MKKYYSLIELPSINALEKMARLVTTVPWQAGSVEV